MIGAALAVVAALAAAAPAGPPPPPARWLTDQAGLLSPQVRRDLDAKLERYQQATGHQVVVWIDRTLAGAALDDWSVRTFEAWKLGRAGLDDGLALFVLSEDRKIAIEVGYGLEDEVPDAVASRVIREVMAPRLGAGDPDGAVTAGVDAVLAAIEGRPWTGAPGASTETQVERPAWVTWGGGALLAVLALILFIKYPRAAMWLFWMLLASRGRGGGGMGGIGGGGLRGGGGRSGGGGARGGW